MNRWAYGLAALWAILLCASAQSIRAADITVDAGCNLSDAIKAANSDAGHGACAAGAGADRITLTADIRLRAALPAIMSDVVIDGEGHAISGAEAQRIFHVAAGGKLSISNLHMLEGKANDCPLLIRETNRVFFYEESSCGGAIVNQGNVSVRDSSFSKHLRRAAIVNFHLMDISDSSFHDIKASGDCCAAIRNFGELRVSGVSFIGNYAFEEGGTIRNEGQLWIADSRFMDNYGRQGGAIYNLGALHISDSQFSDNSSLRHGGAIFNGDESDMTVENSRFSNNRSRDGGGAIFNSNRLRISNSSFDKNEAVDGGAILNIGRAELTVSGSSFLVNSARLGSGGAIHSAYQSGVSIAKSSLSGNHARNGGAIFNSYQSEISITDTSLFGNSARDDGGGIYVFHGKAMLTHATVARNSAARGGGLFVSAEYDPNVSLLNSIIAGNQDRDCFGRIEQSIGNLDTDGSCFAAFTGEPALDERTGSEGGPTRYLALSNSSPAIGAADPCFCRESDQIGTARPAGDACDIGAIQSSPGGPALSACQVTTTYDLYFRAAPGGRLIGGVPANTRMAALARTGAWFHVEHDGQRGWISADYVTMKGDCA